MHLYLVARGILRCKSHSIQVRSIRHVNTHIYTYIYRYFRVFREQLQLRAIELCSSGTFEFFQKLYLRHTPDFVICT